MTETINETPTPETEKQNPDMSQEMATPQDEEQATFSAEYVKTLREESAAHRVKAKRVDEANQRLLRSVAESDGRLINVDELVSSDDLLDDDGIVDPVKVRDSISALIEAKPYLAARRPTTAIPQGVQGQNNDMPSLFHLVAQRS